MKALLFLLDRTQSIFLITLYLVFLLLFRTLSLPVPVCVYVCVCVCVCVCVFSVAQTCLTLCGPMDCVAQQAPLLKEFSRQEYCSAMPFLTPGDLPNPGIEPCPLGFLHWQ